MDKMTFRVPPHFRAKSLSQKLNPGQSAGELHSIPCSCCAAGPSSGHWEWTRKYQWALLGLITHSKGMTSILLDFLGTCLQLEHPGPRSSVQHREATEQRPGARERKCSFGWTRPGALEGLGVILLFLSWALGLPRPVFLGLPSLLC